MNLSTSSGMDTTIEIDRAQQIALSRIAGPRIVELESLLKHHRSLLSDADVLAHSKDLVALKKFQAVFAKLEQVAEAVEEKKPLIRSKKPAAIKSRD